MNKLRLFGSSEGVFFFCCQVVFESLLQRFGVNDPSKRQEECLTFSRGCCIKLICNLPSLNLLGQQSLLRNSDVGFFAWQVLAFSFWPVGGIENEKTKEKLDVDSYLQLFLSGCLLSVYDVFLSNDFSLLGADVLWGFFLHHFIDLNQDGAVI